MTSAGKWARGQSWYKSMPAMSTVVALAAQATSVTCGQQACSRQATNQCVSHVRATNMSCVTVPV